MGAFQSVKLWLVGHIGLAKDALHIYVGLLLFFGSAALFGWSLRGWKPWAVVCAAAVIGEAWDLCDRLVAHASLDLAGNFHDIWNTLFWPSAIVLLLRRTRLFAR